VARHGDRLRHRQIIFGRENPSKHVVAHEVAHTLQQRNGGVAGPGCAPYPAEGAVQGITVMATLSVTF
jgi:Mlc titration factor MtfA (ptsG expression regulator)